MAHYAPGMRLIIRDEEWLVKRVDKNTFGSETLIVTGLSRLVKDKESIFISQLEDITTIKPEETKLIPDKSPQFIESRLYMESLLRRKAPTDNRLYVGHKAAMNTLEYQLDPAIISLDKPRQRILIADAVGLGKTLEAGILMSELILRGKGKRILVVTVKSMMTQFQKEMWNRFSIPLVKLDSQGIQRIRSKIPSNHNPFYYYDKTIVSIDTLKRDSEYRNYLENSWWDIIVIDEAHNVAERGNHVAQRARLAKLLSERSDTLIMLSATPHDGRPESFASLMNMLDPTAIANPKDYSKEDIKGLCVRRFKKDIQDQVEGNFKERQIHIEKGEASWKEEEVFDYFSKIQFKTIDGGKKSGDLFKTTLEKSLFSSPAACIKTLTNRLNKLAKEDITEDREHDIKVLSTLKSMLESIKSEEFTRYAKLVELLKSKDYNWNPKNTKDRIVIFTERIETLKFLKENLLKDLKLKENNIEIMHGGMSDIDLQKIVDDFGREDSKLRVLVASDVASEGINLHYLSHRLIHFDIPWSLMVFQQRNGRIDRYGQEEVPDIRYLMTISDNVKIKGDTRILEVLVEKEKQAVKNIGDPAALMNVYDIEEEEKITAQAIEENKTVESFENDLFGNGSFNPLDMMLALMNSEQIDSSEDKKSNHSTLFKDVKYLEDALTYFNQKSKYNFKRLQQSEQIEIDLNTEIKERLKDIMPEDALPKDEILRLSPDAELIQKKIVESRQEKIENEAWPKVQYLWAMHPIIEWINDKASILFGRQEAPVIGLKGVLEKDENIFIISGLIPNRKSHPMVNEWFGVVVNSNKVVDIISMEQLLKKIPLKNKTYPNTAGISEDNCRVLEKMLPNIIVESKKYMGQKLKEFDDINDPKLQEEMDSLEALRSKHHEQLSFDDTLATRKKEEKARGIDKKFDEFMKWVEDTMTLDKNPYIQLVAVMTEVK
ncbi:DEAD/DEAH box helicase [Clostridium butyricum]|uniref:DEAD/DEAH box helicase n=1 Tax=Clostridium butyricum TaxID=1492 RepID=UPI0005EB8032|nr:DEAD/DEAH box helicase [Clostridium butyricum]MDB2155158.1 DEAD/DEAH box helicase [Clostridium butyricum]